jgi:hypothetical protein
VLNEQAIPELGQKQYVTLIIRLLIDPQGGIQGTLVDLNEDPIAQFQRLDGLPDIIRKKVADLLEEEHDDPD